MLKIKSLWITSLLIALLGWTVATGAQARAEVRFVHAFPDAGAVDLYINGTIAAEGVSLGVASEYIEVPAGALEITALEAGGTTELFAQTVTVDGATPVTLIVSDASGFVAYLDNVDPLSVGQARLTAVHAIEGAPAVDILLVDGRKVFSAVEYQVPYGTFNLPVFNYPLTIVPAGGELTDALLEAPFNAPLATGTSYTIVIYGTLEAAQTLILSRAVNPNAGDGFLQLTHNVEGADAVDIYANNLLIAPGIAFEQSTEQFPLPAGDYTVQIAAANTITPIAEASISVATGSLTEATVDLDGDTVIINTSASASAVVEVAPTAAPTAAPAEQIVVATPAAAQQVVVATPVAAQQVVVAPVGSPIGTVNLNPGANLQLRQYPDAEALSLGLAPSGSALAVNGREGAPIQIEGLFSQELQDQIEAFVDPAEGLDVDSDLDPAQTWINVSYTAPDGGTITAWVLAQFLNVVAPDGEAQRLADLPLVEANAFGEAAGTVVTPPPIPDDTLLAFVFNLNPGANLQIRRTPDVFGESLALVPNGTVFEMLGFQIFEGEAPDIETASNAEWAYVRYTTAEGGTIIGWVSTQYIDFQWRGRPIDLEEMEARTLLLFEDPNTLGELSSGVAAPARPTADPLAGLTVATIQLDPGANLQFRRTPDAFSESLGLIPSGSQVPVIARNTAGDWLLIEFEGQEGWIASSFVRITLNGETVELDELLVEDAS
ncbi:MAG: DUF4397 domain-containing protein [Phototrophicaceae bacterium]